MSIDHPVARIHSDDEYGDSQNSAGPAGRSSVDSESIAEQNAGDHLALERPDRWGDTIIRPRAAVGPTVDNPLPAPPIRPERAQSFAAWSARYVWFLLAFDALVGMVAMASAIVAPMTLAIAVPFRTWALLMAIGALTWPLAIGVSHGYERRHVGVGGEEIRAVFRAAMVALALGALPSGLLNLGQVLATIVVAAPAAAAMSVTVRFVSRKILHRRQRAGRNVRRVVLAGSAWTVADLADVLRRETHFGMDMLGVCVPSEQSDFARRCGLEVLGDLDHVAEVVRRSGCDAVAVTSGETARGYLRRLSWDLENDDVELLVHPGLIEVAGPRMHIRPYVGLPLLHVEQPHFTGWRRVLKRLTDVMMTAVSLVVVSPLLLAVAVAIKLEDGGPVIFRQTRVGLDGSTFTMYKFRSMIVDAEQQLDGLRSRNLGAGPLFKMERDPRITRIGRVLRRFSIDELPQLVNVLTGSMSLVGPRPPLEAEVDSYESHTRRRLLVTPGLTGLWQVSGRSLLSWEESIRLDLRYVENWTLTFDLLILWKTFFAVVARRGAF